MAGEKDAGLKALQGGDAEGAVRLLETACAEEPNDYQSHTYLGAAYSQAQRPMDAIHVLTRAVELQPSNAQARYNLGTAMERGGHGEQAAAVYEQALMLQADYPKAQEALKRLKGGAPAPVAPPAPAGQQAVHGAPPQYGAGAAAHFGAPPSTGMPQYGAPQTGAPPAVHYNTAGALPAGGPAQPAPLYGAPPVVAQPTPQYGYGAPPTGAPPAQQYGAPPANPPQAAGGLANYGSAPGPAAAPYAALPQPNYANQPSPAAYTPTPVSKGNSFEGSVAMALLFGAIGGVVGTALWVGIIMTTHYSTGLIGLGVGAIVGFLIRTGNGGGSTTGGIMASIITVFSSVAGNFIAAAILPAGGAGASIGFSIAGIFIAYRIASS